MPSSTNSAAHAAKSADAEALAGVPLPELILAVDELDPTNPGG